MTAPAMAFGGGGWLRNRLKPPGMGLNIFGTPVPATPAVAAPAPPAASSTAPWTQYQVPGGQGTNPYGGDLLNKAKQRFEQAKYRDIRQRSARSTGLYDLYGSALADPTGQTAKYQGAFDTAAQGMAAPAMRDFTQQLASVQGNTAARFGGNASTEENRGVYNTSDLFSRNLSEALARLAPQAVTAGQNATGELGTAARGATGELDQALGGFDPTKLKKGNALAKILGTGLGIAGEVASGGSLGPALLAGGANFFK